MKAIQRIRSLWSQTNIQGQTPFRPNMRTEAIKESRYETAGNHHCGPANSAGFVWPNQFRSNYRMTYQMWTEAHGLYSIVNIPTGGTYLIAVSHKHFEFNPDSLTLFISQDRTNVDFVSNGN
jgi:hypothetical protein